MSVSKCAAILGSLGGKATAKKRKVKTAQKAGKVKRSTAKVAVKKVVKKKKTLAMSEKGQYYLF